MRLRGGFGSQCDLMHSGFVEVFHNNEWGAVLQTAADTLAADVVCRQLGFPHGNALVPGGDPPTPLPPPDAYEYYDPYNEEALPPVGRVWLRRVQCNGPEERLIDCDLGRGILPANAPFLTGGRFTVVCRQFAVEAALEAVTTPGVGALSHAISSCHMSSCHKSSCHMSTPSAVCVIADPCNSSARACGFVLVFVRGTPRFSIW